jgi:MFS family permease
MSAVVGCLAYEFQVSLPFMASHGLHVGSAGYGFMTAAMGIGAVVGGLALAARGKTGSAPLIIAAFSFGISMVLAAIAPDLALELVALTLVGGASVAFMSQSNSTLQLRSAPEMRGRVMALWFVSFQGSTPIGGPIVGAVMAGYGARSGLGVGAVACLVVAAAGAVALRNLRARAADTPDSSASASPLPPPAPGDVASPNEIIAA